MMVQIGQSNLSPIQTKQNYTRPIDNRHVSFDESAKRYMDEEYYVCFISGEGTSKETTAFFKIFRELYN